MKEAEEQISEAALAVISNKAAKKAKKKAKKKEPKLPKPEKIKVPKVVKDLRTIFTERLLTLHEDDLKKPWMATKSFRLIDTAEELQGWVDMVLSDPGRSHTLPWANFTGPVIAVDTETDGLDIRVMNGKMRTHLAGVCLSADGVEGLYIPVGHENSQNIPATQLAPILQKLFDLSYLLFFNAKFDKEVLRLSLGLTFKDYPYFEDTQVDNYLHDPKARVDDDSGAGSSGEGLKSLSKQRLGLEQIELEELTKVKAKVWSVELNKHTQRMVYAPFTWVPTNLALWYAASDAICTWLLWEEFHKLRDFTKMSGVFRLDHQLIDTITWIERQRPRVDKARLSDTIIFHENRVKQLTEELGRISGMEDFNPGSPSQISRILFDKLGMPVLERSEKTNEPSTAIGVLKELHKRYPTDEFLTKLMDFREYAALHPGSVRFDPADSTIRFYLKQNVVAGGRLAASGGEFEKDGGCGINPQAIKKVGGNWWVKGKLLDDQSVVPDVESFPDTSQLAPSCFKDGALAPNIHSNNHTATYFGKHYCMVPTCSTCQGKLERVDANEVINFRGLFVADPGWTMFSIDYSNIEMRVAANISKEPLFIKEFLEGAGDFHALTATALFPEYSDPAVPQARKKELRALAKIVNFALLYGGTAYTIFENLSKAGFATTFEEAQELVQRYWDSVPQFALWCQKKRNTARKNLLCYTPTGREINFESAMQGFKIHKPTKEETDNFWAWRNLKKTEIEYRRLKMLEEAQVVKESADEMWRDPALGVKNAQEYNRFLGKAERVAINIPLQGTAGDLMRSALNHIRIWALANPGLEKVFRLHLTVHDEIDFSVRNDFIPYVLPRINRLMKLRTLHKHREWMVPIETDCEYGTTWDLNQHLTGDDSHKAAGWVEIDGLQNYIPPEFAADIVEKVALAWIHGETERVTQWLHQLHPRVHGYISEFNDDLATVCRYVTIMLQLHEFWKIDEDESDTQTFMQYAEENELIIPDEPLIGGLDSYLGSVPPEDPPVIFPEEVKEETQPPEEVKEEPPEAPKPELVEAESFFHEAPRKEPTPKAESPIPVLRNITVDELNKLFLDIGAGLGKCHVSFMFEDEKFSLETAVITEIPKEYLA